MFFSGRSRPISSASIRRGVFLVTHPTLGDRILDQALFRHSWRSDWFPVLAYNECRQKGNLNARCQAAIDRVFGCCDFITLQRQGYFTRSGGLRGVPTVECTVYRVRVDPGHERVFQVVADHHFKPVPQRQPFYGGNRSGHPMTVAAE